MLLPSITPGPIEPDAEQLQEYLKLLVDDLGNLYDHGMDSPACPGTLRVRLRSDIPTNS